VAFFCVFSLKLCSDVITRDAATNGNHNERIYVRAEREAPNLMAVVTLGLLARSRCEAHVSCTRESELKLCLYLAKK
jgi:hypothetical protein